MKKNLQIGKKIALTLVLFLTVAVVNAADRYAVATGNWNSTATWSATDAGGPGASIPVAGDNVYIVRGFTVTIPNAVTVACSNVFVTLQASSGTGTLTFGGATATLNVSGNVVVGSPTSGSREGVINMTAGGVLSIGGNLTIGNEGATTPVASEVNQGANSSVTVTGNVSILTPNTNNYANQWQVNAGTATVGGTFTMANTAGANQDCNLIITTGTMSIEGAITMGGATTENTISITGAGTLNIGGSISATNGTLTLSATSKVNYDGAAQTLRAGTYQDLTFSGSGAKSIPAATTVNGRLSVQDGATVTGTAPTYGVNAILEYKGTTAKNTTNVEFPGTVNVDLVIDNSGGVTLNGAKNLSGSLTLTNGVVNTTATNILNMEDNYNVVIGGSVNSYINGPMRKTGNNSFTFPVGKAGIYSPITISAPNENTDAFTAEYVRASATALGSITATGIFRVSNCEYWDLDETADPGNNNSINVTVGWFSYSGCSSWPYISTVADIRLVHFNGTNWDTQAGTATGTVATGTVTRNAVTAFSPFTLGSVVDEGNALPVSFANVKAFEKGTGVQIEWTNLTESDISGYVVERSANGIDFTAIGQVAPRSNQADKASYIYNDLTPLNGTNFYRVKALELAGKSIYTKSLRVDMGRTVKGISLYPNPVKGSDITIAFSAGKGLYNMSVLNTAGQVVYRQQLNHAGGTVSQQVSLPSLKAGMYNVLVSGDNYKETKMFVIQ